MDASLLAVLNDSERLLVAETEPAVLAELDEDAVVALHTRVRRARGKYVSQYRRAAASRVTAAGARGRARPQNTTAALKAEAFEQALARVSRRLGALAAQSAAELKTERLAAARAAKQGRATSTATARPRTAPGSKARSVTDAPTGDRALRSPATEKRRAGTTASGARRQAKRDSR